MSFLYEETNNKEKINKGDNLCDEIIFQIIQFIKPEFDFSLFFSCKHMKNMERKRYIQYSQEQGLDYIKRNFFPMMNAQFVLGRITKLKINQLFSIIDYRFEYDIQNLERKTKYYNIKDLFLHFKRIDILESKVIRNKYCEKLVINDLIDMTFYKKTKVVVQKNKFNLREINYITKDNFRNIYALL